MFTKNFYDDVFGYLSNVSIDREATHLVAIDGTTYASISNPYSFGYTKYPIYSFMNSKAITSYLVAGGINNVMGFVFGTGNKAPTADDTNLSGTPINSANIATTQLFTYNFASPLYEITCTYTITNNGSEAITIGEIGLFNEFYYRSQSYGNHMHYPVLIERTALESPITIEAGSVGQVTYTIKLNCAT